MVLMALETAGMLSIFSFRKSAKKSPPYIETLPYLVGIVVNPKGEEHEHEV